MLDGVLGFFIRRAVAGVDERRIPWVERRYGLRRDFRCLEWRETR